MIRRGFWLAAGAVTGIYGYRRVAALGRRVSGTLNLAGPGTPAKPVPRPSPRGHTTLARQAIWFARDVREGMQLYTARHSAPEGSTLGARDPELTRGLSTDHDPQPKDGR
jgi:hypothetical protein